MLAIESDSLLSAGSVIPKNGDTLTIPPRFQPLQGFEKNNFLPGKRRVHVGMRLNNRVPPQNLWVSTQKVVLQQPDKR
jgi:hypothetical protein